MKIAFCLFRYFPYGGLQKDFMRIAKEAHRRGHDITVFTMHWDGEKPEWMNIQLINPKGFTNHEQAWRFSHAAFEKARRQHFDRVVGFNKMHGLDVYYAADGCFVAKESYRLSPWRRLLSRYRIYSRLERCVFSSKSNTKVLLISKPEMENYKTIYQTQDERLHLLPPGISRKFIEKANDTETRKKIRDQFEIPENDFVLLEVGSSFNTKGIDRSLQALSCLPLHLRSSTHLFVAGLDKRIHNYRKLAEQLELSNIYFLGPRDDIPDLMAASDLLIHPARQENTGTALLEALVAGLPVLATANCGYAHYITESQGGLLVDAPFKQEELNNKLKNLLDRKQLKQLKFNALKYCKDADLYSLIERAVDIIES